MIGYDLVLQSNISHPKPLFFPEGDPEIVNQQTSPDLDTSPVHIDFPPSSPTSPSSPHLELGRQWKITIFYTFCIKRRVRIFNTKICMETILENLTHKICYDYFQAYDITLICSLFVRLLYFN
jgi:hypothetical protein